MKKTRVILLFLAAVAIALFVLHRTHSHSGTQQHALDVPPSSHVGESNDLSSDSNVRESFKFDNLPSDSNVKESLKFDDLPSDFIVNMNLQFHNVSSDPCPTVHVVMIVVGYDESRNSFLAIKSILMYRKAKIHFHFVTDSIAQKILKPMMSSWLLPGVEFDFYDVAEAWSHTPGNMNQMSSKEPLKVVALYQVLPSDIDAVVVIDPDLIITASVSEMFHHTLKDLGETRKLIALSSSECTIQCSDGTTIQRKSGHTTPGVMVLNLAGMRYLEPWRKMWESKGIEPRDTSSITSLENVRRVSTTLRCDWNMYDHFPSTVPEDCLAKISVFGQQLQSETLRGILQYIQHYDGYQLRFKGKDKCYDGDPKLMKPSSAAVQRDKCSTLKWEGSVTRRVYPYLLDYDYSPSDPYDVTIVGHVNMQRLYLVENISRHWEGAMSLGIDVNDSDVKEVFDFVSNSETLSQRKNIGYHLLFKVGPCYPINPLRTIGQKFATTPYVLFIDIDFIPSYGLYNNLKDTFKKIGDMNKKVLVVPSFETNDIEIAGTNYPRNKQEMVQLMDRKVVWQFHGKGLFSGQGATNYAKWGKSSTTSPYYATWTTNYEPYVAAKTSVLPFDWRFVCRNHNKMIHNEELHMAHYTFMVEPNGFLIHVPHSKSKYDPYPYDCYRKRYYEWKRDASKKHRSH